VARRIIVILLASALAASVVAAPARADGDPASDVLLGENVFYPYQPAVSQSIQKTLDAETSAAARAHFPIKVALIASPVDLGVIPDLFGKPQQYAQFLDQEISFQTKQPLLVVMSTGYGVQGIDGPAAGAVASISKPASGQSDDLARGAITAVAKLAQAAGHPIAGVSGLPAGTGSGGGSSGLLIALLAAAAAATAAALAVVTLRRRNPSNRR
jgi:hypothetical protein